VLAEHKFGVAGDYRATVIVTDSARRRTTMSASVRVGFTDGAQLVGEGMLQSGVALGSGVYSPAARTAFRLAAPLALKTAANTPFVFRLLGSTSFKGETLDRITLDGNRVKLEGTGQLANRPGYRFVIDAVAGEGDALASASRIRRRISLKPPVRPPVRPLVRPLVRLPARPRKRHLPPFYTAAHYA
jgi:hypothetical protein